MRSADKTEITLDRMRSFVRVAERGNLSAVAREYYVGQATVSRHIAELEQALGVRLLNRTTRSVSLTPEGTAYYNNALAVLRLVEEATDDARRASGGLTGKIRVSCTAALGVRHVAAIIFAFQDQYPDVVVDLSLSDVQIDLVREAADIAIRLGPLPDSSMQCRAIGRSRRILVASRRYLEEHGRPSKPDELRGHRMIRMSNVAGSDMLSLHGPNETSHNIPVEGQLLVDHGLAAREALKQGRGIAAAHVWLIDDLLMTGELERVLPASEPESVPLSVLIAPGRGRIKRIRMMIDTLVESLHKLSGVV